MIFAMPGILLAFLGTVTIGTVGTLIGVVVLLVGFLAGLNSKQKDSTITTWRGEAEAHEARASRLTEELLGAQERADSEHEARRRCENRISGLEGEIKTLERYTAQEALATVASELQATRETIVAAINAQGELTMGNMAILSKLETLLGADKMQPPRESGA